MCTACPPGQVTGILGANNSSACAPPPALPTFNATLYNAAGSCAAALTLFNNLYNTTLDTSQQVTFTFCGSHLQAWVRCHTWCHAWAGLYLATALALGRCSCRLLCGFARTACLPSEL